MNNLFDKFFGLLFQTISISKGADMSEFHFILDIKSFSFTFEVRQGLATLL